MRNRERRQLARDIAAMAHGKSLYALTPVLEALGPEHREKVYSFLANEYETFAASLVALLDGAAAGPC